jgi:hypothetical protein
MTGRVGINPTKRRLTSHRSRLITYHHAFHTAYSQNHHNPGRYFRDSSPDVGSRGAVSQHGTGNAVGAAIASIHQNYERFEGTSFTITADLVETLAQAVAKLAA